jgi:chromosome segregation ATPase
VKLLEEMLETSKADAQKERELFAKYKCYCDTNTDEKEAAIKQANNDIAMLNGDIELLLGSSGKLSSEVAKLKAAMADNKEARDTAEKIREKENKAFVEAEADMEAAIESMKNAISTLAAIGADQTDEATRDKADHEFKQGRGTFMQRQRIVHIGENVRVALKAAGSLLSVAQKKTVESFLQGPSFTGTYSSQSGEIIGILKNMRDTFEENLVNARDTEAKAVDAHEKFMATKQEEFDLMEASYTKKQGELGENDSELGSKRKELATTETQLAEDTQFLEELTAMCKAKTAQYEDRKMIRSKEDAAISQAISILNSDEAFETFGNTKTAGDFVQLKQTSRVRALSPRQSALKMLLLAAKKTKSLKLTKVAVALQATSGNAFTKVLKSIDEMVKTIEAEGKADQEKFDWCEDEQTTNEASKKEKNESIDELNTAIDQLTADIEDLTTKLAEKNQALVECKDNQVTATKTRAEEHEDYSANVANLIAAEKILHSALKTLKDFYKYLHMKQGAHTYTETAGTNSKGGFLKAMRGASIDELKEACSGMPDCAGFDSEGNLKSEIGEEYSSDGSLYTKTFEGSNPVTELVQSSQPAPPETFDDEYAGQRENASGETGAVGLLARILKETHEEEDQAHADETSNAHSYQTEMTELTDEQKTLEKTIESLEGDKADKQATKLAKEQELETTTKDRDMIVEYLAKIEPGCTFIQDNLDKRIAARKSESEALKSAKELLEGTPAFKNATEEARLAALGDCRSICVEEGEETAKCKACLAEVSVPGYCAGHPGTVGC